MFDDLHGILLLDGNESPLGVNPHVQLSRHVGRERALREKGVIELMQADWDLD